ncbi:hypothetical protein QE152_g38918 [Popillia japonica]|uniref:Uncharacterized protein n=1 Tax=Popillia japonica TaxID=7064 RepID=A0AAW1HVX3_POPJA
MQRSNHSMETMRRTISRKGECMKNLMAEVAALLGVEIGEEFDIPQGVYNPHKITEEGVFDSNGKIKEHRMNRLLTGEWTIIKKPWKPKDGGRFYYVMKNGKIIETRFSDVDAIDHALLYSGNCFRTEQEAEANREAIMEKFGWGSRKGI